MIKDNNDNNYKHNKDNGKTMYMKHVKDMLLNKSSYELSKKKRKKEKIIKIKQKKLNI